MSLHGDVTYRDSSSNAPGDYTVASKYVLTHHWTNGYARELLNVRWTVVDNLDEFDHLWLRLDRLIHAEVPGDSVIESASSDPWEHPRHEVREVWSLLTRRENRELLSKRLELSLNPKARRITERALLECERRFRA